MAVITITIVESPLEKLAGIPVSISVSTNIPSTVFYTLDGSDPTIASSVVTGPIVMPGMGNVVLKLYATDGTSQSAIITQEYGTSFVGNRQPHDTVTGIDTVCHKATFPFGPPMQSPGFNGIYGNTGGLIVDNPLKAQLPDGYDGTATKTPADYTNEIYPSAYDVIFSETDAIGNRGKGIGTLPANVTQIIKYENDAPESSDANSALFNPKALVIFQDSRQAPYDDDVPQTNRPYFSLENYDRVRDGSMYYTQGGIDSAGSFLRSHYNPRDNTMNYYYYDNKACRWIMSKETYQPKSPNIGNYASMVFSSRGQGTAGFVFKWLPFRYRTLI